jgi:hypothetical protein
MERAAVSTPLNELELQEAQDLAAEMDLDADHRACLCREFVRSRRLVRMLRLLRWRKRLPYQVQAVLDDVPNLKAEAEQARAEEEHRP